MQKNNPKYKILQNFKKELIKQLYKDLFNLNKDLYINEDITYEFFLYNYYDIIEENINFEKPDYQDLLNKLNSIIKKSILFNKQNKKKNKEIEYLYQNSEWELINKYKSSLEMELKMEERKKDLEKKKKYSEELKKQIEENKIINNKNLELKKEEQYLLNENETKKELQEIKIKKSQENINVNDINIKNDYIEIKESVNRDELITKMVDRIINQKKEQKIDKILNGINSKYNVEQKQYTMPELKYDQKKIDDIIYKELKNYQDI